MEAKQINSMKEPPDIKDSTVFIHNGFSCDSPLNDANWIKKHPKFYPKGTRTKSLRKKKQPIFKSFAKSFPVAIAAVLLSVMVTDQGTDVASTYQICSADCQCTWYEEVVNNEDHGVCGVPTETYKETDACLGSFGTLEITNNYCKYAMNQSDCKAIPSWSPNGLRHHNFCISSLFSILVPSIINSTLILISLWNLYPSVLKYFGLSQGSCFVGSFKITLLMMYILQMLPYTWLIMNFLIALKVWKIGSLDGLDVLETWDITTNRWRLIFTILEDTPHLLLHSIYIVNSVIGYRTGAVYAGKFIHDLWSYLGFISSTVSIALSMTLFHRQSTCKTALVKFSTTLVSVGIRGVLCASYASLLIKEYYPRFWPFALPPITAIGLFSIEYSYIFICKFALNFKLSLIRDNVTELRKPGLIKHVKDFSYSIISLSFGGDSVHSLISSYTYLAFAVLLNTAWVSPVEQSFFDFDMNEQFFLVLQYTTFFSLLINLVIVQWEGKEKARCLIYSFIFLMFLIGIYIWVQIDLKSLGSMYIPEDRYANNFSSETLQITLSSLVPILSMAGIICFINIFIILMSLLEVPFLGMSQNIELLKYKLKCLFSQ